MLGSGSFMSNDPASIIGVAFITKSDFYDILGVISVGDFWGTLPSEIAEIANDSYYGW